MVKQTQDDGTQDDDSAWEDVSECDGLVRKRVLQAGSGEVPEPHCVCLGESTSVAVLDEISLSSPRKLFIFIIKRINYRIKVSKK